MKRIYLTVGLILILGLQVMANEGTTKGFYAKPGAPVDLTYRSDPIDNNKSGDINITLDTTVESGKMEVEIAFDDNIINVSNTPSKLFFDVTKEKRSFPIIITTAGKVDGLYYIRLLVTLEKDLEKRTRSLAVPVYIGDYNASQPNAYIAPIMFKSSNKPIKPIENITIFKAKENFEVVKKTDINNSLETNSSVN